MTIQAIEAKQIGRRQLETALALYRNEGDLLSVITLAGAAEEILGKLASLRGQDTSLRSLADGARQIHEELHGEDLGVNAFVARMNRARNSLKHLINDPVELDVEQEAEDMVVRAIVNYWIVEGEITAPMEDFEKSVSPAS